MSGMSSAISRLRGSRHDLQHLLDRDRHEARRSFMPPPRAAVAGRPPAARTRPRGSARSVSMRCGGDALRGRGSRGRSRSARLPRRRQHVQRVAEDRHIDDAGCLLAAPRARRRGARTSTSSNPAAEVALLQLAGRAERHQPAAIDQRDAVAVLRLVHVVGRDQDGDAVGRQSGGSGPRSAGAIRDRRPRSARRETGWAAGAGWRSRAPGAASSRRRACRPARLAPVEPGHLDGERMRSARCSRRGTR